MTGDAVTWHSLTAEEACAELGVDPATGPRRRRGRASAGGSSARTSSRRREKEPGWQAFLRQYRDLMQLVLLGAAIVSIVALQEFSDRAS